MENIAKRLNAYITAHPFDPGDSNYVYCFGRVVGRVE